MAIFNTTISGGGTTPTGTKNITTNGIHDVTNYASADVQVPTTAPAHYIEKAVDANGKLINGSTVIDFTGVTDIGSYVLYYAYYTNDYITGTVDMSDLTTISGQYACEYAFYNCRNITGVDLSSLTSVTWNNSCYYMFANCVNIIGALDLSSLTTASGSSACSFMFRGCTRLTSVDLSSLTTASGSSACSSMFRDCTRLTSVDLSSLTTASGSNALAYMFYGCTGITSIDLSALTTISGQTTCYGMFQGCTGLTSVDLSSLTTVSGNNACQYMFQNCTSLTTLSFPSLTSNSFGSYTNQFNGMLNGVTGCTVHFPSNLQSVIGSWSDVTNGFGGTNTTVLYDLPATNTLTGVDTVTYTRNPKYDTATALAWKVGAYGTTNFTPAYYTSGLTDPTVGTTIYSDAACTVSVTTVSSVA